MMDCSYANTFYWLSIEEKLRTVVVYDRTVVLIQMLISKIFLFFFLFRLIFVSLLFSFVGGRLVKKKGTRNLVKSKQIFVTWYKYCQLIWWILFWLTRLVVAWRQILLQVIRWYCISLGSILKNIDQALQIFVEF